MLTTIVSALRQIAPEWPARTDKPVPQPRSVKSQPAFEEIKAFIRDLRIATVTTTDAQGVMHSCPVAPVTRDFDGELWLPVSRHDPAFSNLHRVPSVLVTYINGETQRCVTLYGAGRLETSNAAWRALPLAGIHEHVALTAAETDRALLRVQVVSADVWG
jgi:general stress protein 26